MAKIESVCLPIKVYDGSRIIEYDDIFLLGIHLVDFDSDIDKDLIVVDSCNRKIRIKVKNHVIELLEVTNERINIIEGCV